MTSLVEIAARAMYVDRAKRAQNLFPMPWECLPDEVSDHLIEDVRSVLHAIADNVTPKMVEAGARTLDATWPDNWKEDARKIIRAALRAELESER